MDRTLPAPASYAGAGRRVVESPRQDRRIRCATVSTTRDATRCADTGATRCSSGGSPWSAAPGVVVNLVVLVMVKRLGPHPEVAIFALRPDRVPRALVPRLLDHRVPGRQPVELPAQPVVDLPQLPSTRAWWREYWPFLAVGMLGQAIGLVLLTLLMHHGSPISLPTDALDDTSGFRTRLYWAQLIVIVVVTPLSFVLNKLWTFAAVRTHHLDAVPPHPAAEQELEHLGVDETDVV